jgi:exo-1,4-beta-D-glucosaminidase
MKMLRLLIPFFSLAFAAAQPSFQPAPALTLPLREGWALQSSARVTATGEAISSASFKPSNWIQADVPTTVVAAQVKSGLLPDPF